MGSVDVKGDVSKGAVASGNYNAVTNITINIENISALRAIMSEKNPSEDKMEKSHNADILEIFNHIKKMGITEEFIKFLNNIPPQSDNTLPFADFVHNIPENNVKIKIKPEEAKSNATHLLVRLIPNPDNRNRNGHELFTFEMYSWKSPNNVQSELRIDNCPLADVREKLDKFIFSEFDESDDIQTIEFILPSELISLDVDQWLMEKGQLPDIETKFGQEYHVFSRLDRDKLHPKLRQKWKMRWEFFNHHCQSHESSVFWVCDHQAYEPKHLCREFGCSDIACCLMMTFLPSDFNGLGQIILHAGIPVAICVRKSEIRENEIRQMVAGKNLSDLPKLICDERKKADHENHIGNHLTLIWDNPDRVIPKEHIRNLRL